MAMTCIAIGCYVLITIAVIRACITAPLMNDLDDGHGN